MIEVVIGHNAHAIFRPVVTMSRLLPRHLRLQDWTSIRILACQQRQLRQQNDVKIERQRPVVDVVEIVLTMSVVRSAAVR